MNERTSIVSLCNDIEEACGKRAWEEFILIPCRCALILCSLVLLFLSVLISIFVPIFWICVGICEFGMSGAFPIVELRIPFHLNIFQKISVTLAPTQAVCTTGVLSMWRQSKAAPPGTSHFPKLSHCVFPLTALFALRPSPKHKSEPPVAVITAPLNRNDK